MRRVGATGTCTQDKHEDGPDDTYMRVLSEPDNMEVQHDCSYVQQEPRSPEKQAVETRSKIEDVVTLEQGSGGEGQERDNQSRNLGSNTQMQQDARARPLLHVSPIEDNPEEQQSQCIGVVETAAEQDGTGVLIKTKKKNQNQEQEDRECDARAAPCQEDAEQELHAGKTGGDRPQEQEEGDSSREDRARAHARARQATQVSLNETGGASGEEAEAHPEEAHSRGQPVKGREGTRAWRQDQ